MRNSVDKVNHSETHASSSSGEGVLELVHRVMHQVRSLQGQALRGTAHEVTHMESKLLAYFARHPGATQSELAQHSGRDKAQLARLVKALRERGLLAAQPDAADRRQQHLSLTPAGALVQRSLRAGARQVEQQVTAGLSVAERQQLHSLLQRLQARLDELANNSPPS